MFSMWVMYVFASAKCLQVPNSIVPHVVDSKCKNAKSLKKGLIWTYAKEDKKGNNENLREDIKIP